MDGNIWESSDNLLLWSELWRLLKLEISNSAGKGEVAVYTTKVNESSGCDNASLLT